MGKWVKENTLCAEGNDIIVVKEVGCGGGVRRMFEMIMSTGSGEVEAPL